MAQMAAAVWCVNAFCTREATSKRHAERLRLLRETYERDAARYALNSSLVSFFDFLGHNGSDTMGTGVIVLFRIPARKPPSPLRPSPNPRPHCVCS